MCSFCAAFLHNEVLGVWCAALSELPLHLRDADARREETTGYIDVFWIRKSADLLHATANGGLTQGGTRHGTAPITTRDG